MLALSGQARRGEAFRTPPGSKDSNGKEEPSGAAGLLPGYFYANTTQTKGGYNLPMSSKNIIAIAASLALGIALGLVYGWVIEPVEFTDVTPDLLREDYRVDYVLMTAEAYQNDFDSEAAARRLAMLGSDPPETYAASAIEYASLNGFTEDETNALQALLTAMQTHQPNADQTP